MAMAEKVLMLALSPTMETGTIAKWNKKEGQPVSLGDILCEVETDKAVMDYESIAEGVLLKIILPEQGEAQVGDTIAIIGEKGEDFSDLLAEITSQKAASEKKEEIPEKTVETTAVRIPEVSGSPVIEPTERIKASPLARRMAQDKELNLQSVRGSGPGGRIIKRDIEKVLEERAKPTYATAPTVLPGVPALTDETIKVSQKRKIIAQRLAESKYSAPHYYLKVTVRMDGVMQARRALNARLKEKVSMNAFLIKFAAEAIKRHPMINATWHGETITKHGSVDIGLAVAQPDGLITPVIRNCANKGIMAIAEELKVLIQKAQNHRLEPEEYTDATFTISSLGSFGIEEFTAIINPPGSAILAVGEIRKEPIVGEDDQILIQSNLKMILSCDHRVIDGVVGAAFLKDLKDMLESPIRTLY